MNFALKIVAVLALVAVVALVGRSLLKKDEPETISPKDYTVRRMDIEQCVYGSGVLLCSKRAEISSRAAGKIAELLVEEGDAVEPGDVLCRFVNEQIENELKNARTNLERAQWEYDRALADYQDKEESYEKHKDVPKKELEKLAEELKWKKWEVDQKQTLVDECETKSQNLTVTSPLKGTVLKSHLKRSEIKLDPDRIYSDGTPLFVVGDLSTLAVEGAILESDRDKIEEGDSAIVHMGRKGNLPAKVTSLSLIPSEGGRYDIHLDFDNPPSGVNEGLTVDFRIVVEKKANVLAVPVEYVQIEGGRHWVQQVTGQKVGRVPIEVGISSDSLYEVKQGLAEGDVIRWDRGAAE
jgi:RND family efflux transporter MFP subunit